MLHLVSLTEIGILFDDLATEHAHWSQKTFGSDSQRGPIGPLKHLELEAVEAQKSPLDPMEHADCLLLVLDASRRAGITGVELLRHAAAKLAINKGRQWSVPTSDNPVEHIR